jgi:3-hydroxyisobutyrate dehydrogenase-like beta-hydroxyacid dehydrogenase
MVGGDQAALNAMETELAAVSTPGRVFHCGAIGAASMLKM